MAAVNDVVVTNNDNSRVFLFRGVSSWKMKKSQGVINIPFVNTTPENTFLFRLMGQTEEISFSFALFDDGTDVSNGTHGSTIITVAQQVAYLKDYIFTDNFDVDWTVTQAVHIPTGITGVITNLDIDANAGYTTKFAKGNFALTRGNIGDI